MGQNLSKYGINGVTNLSKELDIDINNIKECQYMKLEINHEYSFNNLNLDTVKIAIAYMNSCNYIQTNYIYNTKNRIKLIFKDNTEFMLALSDCGSYIGIPTCESGMGLWFYLIDSNPNHNIKYTPFTKLI